MQTSYVTIAAKLAQTLWQRSQGEMPPSHRTGRGKSHHGGAETRRRIGWSHAGMARPALLPKY